MTRRPVLDEAQTPDGERLTLSFEEGHHVVRVRGEVLMSSRVSGSEEALARLAVGDRKESTVTRVLVGGLGMGFTLRAVLDLLAPTARVDVLELLPSIVAWNRNVLADHAGRPLDDPRVAVIVGDVLAHLADAAGTYDTIILDIDNGPEAFTVAANDRLYGANGLARVYAALCDGGVMVLWSAFRSPRFEKRLRDAGFHTSSVTVRARGNVGKGARHTVFCARRGAPGAAARATTPRA